MSHASTDLRQPSSDIAIAVIPARYASTRFPGKPLANRTGKYLIQHVVERARLAKSLSRVVVATDDARIAQAVQSFGGEVVMTRSDHPNGTSRIAEAVAQLFPPGHAAQLANLIVVNVQGDEPEMDAMVVDDLVAAMRADPAAVMGTVASPFAPGEDPGNPNIVKVVCAQSGRALYFSRARIPHDRDAQPAGPPARCLKHIGLYAYRPDFLAQYVTLAPTPLEQTEQLEQLRVLEHGYPIVVIQRSVNHHGIDTPEQYEAFVQRCRHP